MWVLTRSEWPVLVNLDRAAVLNYQQVAKYDHRTRIIASAWEQDYVLAECGNGDEARGLVLLIARCLDDRDAVVDLNAIDRDEATGAYTEWNQGHRVATSSLRRNHERIPDVQSE
ncbi:MAG: hypothetical protein U0031_14545 [Thermomicrobiales bacterium]